MSIKFQQFYLPSFLFIILNIHGSLECFIEICHGTSTRQSQLQEYCIHNLTLDGRCCNNNKEIIGLDLSNCSLNTLNDILSNFTFLKYLDLSDNPIQNCSEKYFKGLINLDELYLPIHCNCPGNDTAWKNVTEEYCYGQNNACHYLNVYCAENGECLPDGPGLAVCDCMPHYYSYKCMRKGKFPYAIFTSLMITLTVLLSASLWYFLRRHAKVN